MPDLSQITTTTPIDRAADRLIAAATTGQPCAPVRDLIGPGDVNAAYAVQQRTRDARLAGGTSVAGWKIGLTSAAVQQQLGVDQPDFGVLFDDMEWDEATPLPLDRLLQPRIEAEIAFVLDSDLTDGSLSPEQVRSAVGYAVPALEIVDSRIANWDIRLADTIADNASSGLFVLGSTRRSIDDFEPAATTMIMTVNGESVSSGSGAACLGDPLTALQWLAQTARGFGEPLRAGQVILSGALGPMHPLVGPSDVRAEISLLGEVSASFIIEEAS